MLPSKLNVNLNKMKQQNIELTLNRFYQLIYVYCLSHVLTIPQEMNLTCYSNFLIFYISNSMILM